MRSTPWAAESQSATAPNRPKGALVGGGIGLLAGGLLGGLTTGSDAEDAFAGSPGEGLATAEGVVLGALLGVGVGAILGATVFAPSRSTDAEMEGASTSAFAFMPVVSGGGVGATLRWRTR